MLLTKHHILDLSFAMVIRKWQKGRSTAWWLHIMWCPGPPSACCNEHQGWACPQLDSVPRGHNSGFKDTLSTQTLWCVPSLAEGLIQIAHPAVLNQCHSTDFTGISPDSRYSSEHQNQLPHPPTMYLISMSYTILSFPCALSSYLTTSLLYLACSLKWLGCKHEAYVSLQKTN